jgi:hypothetical protein
MSYTLWRGCDYPAFFTLQSIAVGVTLKATIKQQKGWTIEKAG